MMPTPEKGEHWGILGGVFDPVHRGHITLSLDIQRIKKLTGIILVPSVNHPFKKDRAVASFPQRVEMLVLATNDIDCFLIEEVEKEQKLSGYTLDTVRAIKKRYPEVTFCFLMGSDNLEQIQRWHQPRQILAEVSIIAGTRPGFEPDLSADSLLSQIEYVETTAVDVSSSEIRSALRNPEMKHRLDEWLDPRVKQYILSEGLYL